MNVFQIRPPCHPEANIGFQYGTFGRPYMTYERVESMYCDAPGCYNEWDEDGNPV